jgi:hypothetical protein
MMTRETLVFRLMRAVEQGIRDADGVDLDAEIKQQITERTMEAVIIEARKIAFRAARPAVWVAQGTIT